MSRIRVCIAVLGVLLSETAAAQISSGNDWRVPPKTAYIHAGLGGNLYYLTAGDMEALMSPFKASAVNFGYCIYAAGGFKNIGQLEMRWGRDSNKFFYDQGFTPSGDIARTEIPMRFTHTQWLIKLNTLAMSKDICRYCLFLIYGRGSVQFLDDGDDGFKDGTKTIIGIEIAKILKFSHFSVALERHQMSFERFSISGIGEAEEQFGACAWQLIAKIGGGPGA